MNNERASQQVKRATVEATIIRADGRIEKLGVVGVYEAGWLNACARFISDLLRRIAP